MAQGIELLKHGDQCGVTGAARAECSHARAQGVRLRDLFKASGSFTEASSPGYGESGVTILPDVNYILA